jgi:hypothetical protein
MSSDISVSAGAAVYVAPLAVSTQVASTTSTASQAIPSVANTGLAPRPSPVSLLDPSTGLVVLEFYNAKGVETSSLPTRRALENYRLHEPSYSVFEPAIHDGTVPQPSTGKPSVYATTTSTVQAVVTAQATASSTDRPAAAASTTAGNNSSTGIVATET